MELKGSKTEKNLLAAFAGESQARNKYTFFAKIAEKEGYHQISRVFLQTADHERLHAKNFFRALPGGVQEITATFHSGVLGTTPENLQAAIDGEHEENMELYPAFAQKAREEGFEEIARLFLNIVVAEKYHEERYRKLLKILEEGKVWKRDEPVSWTCSKCGFTMDGKEPPGKCPACQHPKEYFELTRLRY